MSYSVKSIRQKFAYYTGVAEALTTILRLFNTR